MPAKKTWEEFVISANIIHNNRFTYPDQRYENSKTPVMIICPDHGKFSQTPNVHLRGHGCKTCGYETHPNLVPKTVNEFISDANTVHNNFYGYLEFKYITALTKGIITCPLHGDFMMKPNNHLNGQGCRRCAFEKLPQCKPKSTEQFIIDAYEIHGNLYGYSKFIYIGNSIKGIIICDKHGEFTMQPNAHLNGQGCPKCGNERAGILLSSNTSEFTIKANILHNFLYTYGNTNYVGCETPVIITCKTHGDFKQTPHDHLSGAGCPKCGHLISYKEINFLNYLNMPDTKDHRQVKLSGKKVDGYDSITNTIYEFFGDYWHGNPVIYPQDDMNKAVKKSYGELYKKTMARLDFLYNKGYKIKYIWENEWIKFTKNKVETPLIIDYIPTVA